MMIKNAVYDCCILKIKHILHSKSYRVLFEKRVARQIALTGVFHG